MKKKTRNYSNIKLNLPKIPSTTQNKYYLKKKNIIGQIIKVVSTMEIKNSKE